MAHSHLSSWITSPEWLGSKGPAEGEKRPR